MDNGAGGAPLIGAGKPRMRMQVDRSAVPCEDCGLSFREMSNGQVVDHLDFWTSRALESIGSDREELERAVLAAACYSVEIVHRVGEDRVDPDG